MRKLGTICYDAFDFDDAIQIVTEQFNELRRSNPTTEYKDIDITFGFFRRTWVVLVYEYDDQGFPAPEPLPTPDKEYSVAHMGMKPGLDPRDPLWRQKQSEWEAERDDALRSY